MVTFEDVESAAAQIAGVAHRTPVVTSRLLDEACAAEVHLKCENLQRVGAFKFRGAYNAVSRLSDAEKTRGVITYSSGNHAQALALVCRILGVRATIVMPQDAPAMKLAATRDYGATIVTYDPATETREAISARLAAEHGYTLIPPYDHPHIIAGQSCARGLSVRSNRPGRWPRRRQSSVTWPNSRPAVTPSRPQHASWENVSPCSSLKLSGSRRRARPLRRSTT